MIYEKYRGYCNICNPGPGCCKQCSQKGFMEIPSQYVVKLSKRWDLYDTAIQKWGIPAQEGMLIEEIGEVLTSLNKKNRVRNGIDHSEFVTELVDLEIMLEQMKVIHTDEKSWNQIKERKIKKLLYHLQTDKS
ncbi:MAG: hypothetical protein HF975_04215 [ANME-2 cluster archaeon]|nr:hypothetical protein [ANME-2 cluster archaeon]